MEFCRKLNEMGKAPDGWMFTLPTEEMWEYAAHGGRWSNGYRYSGGNDVGEVAWYYNNAGATRPVAKKNANELGLYDMCGNVGEWCLDRYEADQPGNQAFPKDSSVSYRCFRGSYWNDSAGSCRLAYSYGRSVSTRRDNELGFRVALVQLKRGR